MNIDYSGRQQLEAIIDNICAREKIERPTVVWCKSVVEALCEASLIALTQEMRRVLDADDCWDFDVKDVDLAIEALTSDASERINLTNLRAGMSELFRLGGEYGTPKRELPFFDHLKCSLEQSGYTARSSQKSGIPEAFIATCGALNEAVKASTALNISERVHMTCALGVYGSGGYENNDLEVELVENITDQLQETWSHIRVLDPLYLCDPRAAKQLGIWWLYAYEGTVWVSGGPEEMYKDEQGLLSCSDGPAVSFHEGEGSWFWHGEQVPSSWLDGTLSSSDVENVNSYLAVYLEIEPYKAPEVLADILRSKES